MYYCYLLYSPSTKSTYIGITNTLEKRLREHNGFLKGGAKATRKASDWEFKNQVSFPELELAASFEWYAKHKKNGQNKWVRTSGLEERQKRFQEVLSLEKFKLSKNVL